MTKVIVSNHSRQVITELFYASNITWRKALSSYGYCSFDLALSDPFASATYLNPGNWVHIYNDFVDSSVFANADFGGVLNNDYEIKPKNAIVTIQGAGIGQLFDVAVTVTTQNYANIDVGSLIDNLITTCDNYAALNITRHTIDTLGPVVTSYVAGWGNQIFTTIQQLCKDYGGDFEVRPDWTYAYYVRQGQDNPNLVVRYGEQGNVQVETNMHFVNTEMGNQIYNISTVDASQSAYIVNTTSVQYYGPKTVVIQDDNTYSAADALTKAQFAAIQKAFPQTMMDNVTMVDSSLFPFFQLHLGDAVLFEAPSLSFLQSFQGLQRILAVEYDDRKRIMNLSMGNALYIVLRGRLHEVRLYVS
jgi:hypothetical protein